MKSLIQFNKIGSFKIMKKWIFAIIGMVGLTPFCKAEFIDGESISDKNKVDICVSRAANKTKLVEGFLIDRRFVEIQRESHADAVFAAINPNNPQLVVCYTRSSTGKFEPASYLNSSNKSDWKIKRPENPIDVGSYNGQKMVINKCKDGLLGRIDPHNIKSVTTTSVGEVNRNSGVRNPIGLEVNKVKALKYDVVTDGRIILNTLSNGIDHDTVDYKCLLDPSFKIKSIEIKAL